MSGILLNPYAFAAGGPAPPVLWTPADITTALWLDASDGTTINIVSSAVEQWNDKSGNGRHFSQGTSGRRPTILSAELNGLNVMRFDGTDDCLLTNSNDGRDILRNTGHGWAISLYKKRGTDGSNLAKTIFTVTNGTDGSTRYLSLCGNTANVPAMFVRRADGDGTGVLNDTTANSGNWLSVVHDMKWADGDGFVYQNGELKASNTSLTSNGSTSDTRSVRAVLIGAYPGGTGTTPTLANVADIDLAEIVVGRTELTTGIRQRTEGYLHHKFGVASLLPGGHPYKNAPPTQEWTPADITTALWLDAADGTTVTGSPVSQWSDKSGNGRHATQGSSGLRPTYTSTLNGLPVLTFDGTSFLIADAVASVIGGNDVPWSACIVYNIADNGANHCLVSATSSTLDGVQHSVNRDFLSGANAIRSTRRASDTQVNVSGNVAAADGPGLLSLVFTGTAVQLYDAGSEVANAAQDNASLSVQRFSIGVLRRSTNATFVNGDIGEIVLLPAAASTATRQRIEGYLAHKWGLEGDLPSDHPYKAAPPTI
jgi:hypothetical protein